MHPIRLFLIVSALALASATAASAYSWPFRPFDRQHPIRGFFGDPRTVFENGILAGGFDGPGLFSFHQGVDISAPDGTPIYAVEDGTAHYIGAAILNVVTDHDVIFQFFHIVPVVGEGEHVIARRTLLGYVQPPFGHVHLTEIDGTHAVNPLQPGHLTPYNDTTKPVIREIGIRNEAGDLQTPLGLCGRVEFDADAYDLPPVPVPGKFGGLPVTPALVEWTLTRLGGTAVVPWHVVADFRDTLPSNADFWNVYAKGTYQNVPRFGLTQYNSMPGRFLFLLSRAYDTTTLANGVYIITVLVADGHGHKDVATQRISVLNAKGADCPGS
ncbi:MAG TPA: M23 family metallopeptidase, partial [Gaiellaceae bacterium]|nr:M23 family metallopeptidase [Gaiellaceae bacterium]